MHGSKLLETLCFFSSEELNSLDRFLRSPYFVSDKQQKEIYLLFQYIFSYYGNWSHPDLNKTKVYQHLYDDKKIIKGKIDKQMSALLKQIHRFIAIHFKKNKENHIDDLLNLAVFFRLRNASKREKYFLEKVKKEHAKSQFHDRQYYLSGFKISTEEIQHHLVLNQPLSSFNFNSALNPLDIYYLLTKLDYICFILSIDHFRKPVDIHNLSKFLDTLKPHYIAQGYLNIPLVKIYYQAYEMLKELDGNSSAYQTLKELVLQHEASIPFESRKRFNGLIRGLAIRRHNYGEKHKWKELFHLYRTHLEKNYLNFKDGILPSTFKNLVGLGLKAKAYDWVHQFLDDYKDKIDGPYNAKDLYNYNLACYHFALKNYDQAQELLVGQYEDIQYKIAAKRIELKIFYEEKSEILEAKMDAFKVYIFRLPKKEILARKRASNNHFIDFLRQLHHPKTAISAARIEKLIKKIHAIKFLYEQDWLIEKLEELKEVV